MSMLSGEIIDHLFHAIGIIKILPTKGGSSITLLCKGLIKVC